MVDSVGIGDVMARSDSKHSAANSKAEGIKKLTAALNDKLDNSCITGTKKSILENERLPVLRRYVETPRSDDS